MSGPTLIIMAAGLGSRYGGLKQLDAVGPCEETILDYCVFDACRAGFSRVVFVIREEMRETFRQRIGLQVERHIDTAYVFQKLDHLPVGFAAPSEREKPWGTAHAVWCCRDVVDTSFAAINADDFYGPSSYKILCDWFAQADSRAAHDYCMAGYLLKNTLSSHGHVSRGECRVSDKGELIKVDEHTHVQLIDGAVMAQGPDGGMKKLSEDTIVSMNFWGFTPALFDQLEQGLVRFLTERGEDAGAEYFLPAMVSDCIHAGDASVTVLPTNEKWLGITYREDKPTFQQAIKEMIRRGAYPEKLWG